MISSKNKQRSVSPLPKNNKMASQEENVVSQKFKSKLDHLIRLKNFKEIPDLLENDSTQQDLIQQLEEEEIKAGQLQKKLKQVQQKRKSTREYLNKYIDLTVKVQSQTEEDIWRMKLKHIQDRNQIKDQIYDAKKLTKILENQIKRLKTQKKQYQQKLKMFFNENGGVVKETQNLKEAKKKFQREYQRCFLKNYDYKIKQHHQVFQEGKEKDEIVDKIFQQRQGLVIVEKYSNIDFDNMSGNYDHLWEESAKLRNNQVEEDQEEEDDDEEDDDLIDISYEQSQSSSESQDEYEKNMRKKEQNSSNGNGRRKDNILETYRLFRQQPV